MQDISQQKRDLLNRWLAAHAPGNSVLLFANKAPHYELTVDAIGLLKNLRANVEMSLYIVCLGNPEHEAIVAYVGKAANPWRRWQGGHLKKLREVVKRQVNSSYTRWVDLFETTDRMIYLICIDEREINFSPIPEFPNTVGAIEYQLISLAQDCFPEYLLNQEGVGR